ncbi:hypothetical protein J1605_007498 [Eschrichtius robustus]|uniref:Uncharacterized protein n=1 Tax=Eschrichtius robustus TaxID=9764 RepID=A0AB34H155_ESCRO|nr:hypothetical protein J1605_007498 [Eschrichtius robustus]
MLTKPQSVALGPCTCSVTWGSQPSQQEEEVSVREGHSRGGSGEPPSAPRPLESPEGWLFSQGPRSSPARRDGTVVDSKRSHLPPVGRRSPVPAVLAPGLVPGWALGGHGLCVSACRWQILQ